jgi:hypothetical protein
MTEEMELTKYCLEEGLLKEYGYIGKPLRDMWFSRRNEDMVNFCFGDGAIIGISHLAGSLAYVEYWAEGKVKRRLIPTGKPTYDEHFSDIFSFAAGGKDVVLKGEEFKIQEEFSEDNLSEIIRECMRLPLLSIEQGFGLKHCLEIRFGEPCKNVDKDNSKKLRFMFPKNSTICAIYKGNGREIAYIP